MVHRHKILVFMTPLPRFAPRHQVLPRLVNDYSHLRCVRFALAAFVRVHGLPSTSPKTGDPSSSPSTPKRETAKISYPDVTSTSTTTTSTTMTVWFENDYFLYPKTSATTTSPTVRRSRLRLLRPWSGNDYFVYFPDFDYVCYFLHAPKTPALPRRSPLSGVEPEDLRSTRLHPNPKPYT